MALAPPEGSIALVAEPAGEAARMRGVSKPSSCPPLRCSRYWHIISSSCLSLISVLSSRLFRLKVALLSISRYCRFDPTMARERSRSPADLPKPKRTKIDDQGANYTCVSCGVNFSTNRTLLRHARESKAHTADYSDVERPYRCRQEKCEKSFVRSYNRERHEKEQHGDGKKACGHCGKRIRPKTEHKDYEGQLCAEGKAITVNGQASNSNDSPSDDDEATCDGTCFLKAAEQEKWELCNSRATSEKVRENHC